MKPKFQTKIESVRIAVTSALERTFRISVKIQNNLVLTFFSETKDTILEKLLGGKEMFIGMRD